MLKIFILTSLKFVLISSSFDLRINDPCTSSLTNDEGICVEPINCPDFRQLRNQMNICSFDGKIPVVCCPKASGNRQGGGDSKRKSDWICEKYSALSKIPAFPTMGFVGGVKTDVNEFPHMTAIGVRGEKGIDWKCGGSLISEDFVITAAHCVPSFLRIERMVARVGDKNLNDENDGAIPQEFGISRVFLHPDYQSGISKYHDLALLKLSRNATFNKNVMPACLYQSSQIEETNALAMGWGATSFAGKNSEELLKGYLNLVNNENCSTFYQDDEDIKEGIIESQICAGDETKQKDTCQGDSGGPLQLSKITDDGFKFYQLIGVTSFGRFCAAGTPGVYSRISSYLDWIESVVWP